MSEFVNRHVKNHICTHILYSHGNNDSYFKNAVDYLVDGVESGESVILIESERNLLILEALLAEKLTKEQMKKVNMVNNYEFYQSSGSYHPPVIFEQVNKTLNPYLENDISFRTWTNVEWGTLEDPSHIVDYFEKGVDQVVYEHELTLVCAYEAEKMPPGMQSVLEETHLHIMTDDDLIKSVLYKTAAPKIGAGK
ncbi:MEDS domain-containing protein [Bacillus salacetis]|uniref:MEDS domain-containing protein n=1 Tax=Bacillus salacetis TaxID=2315464 RepID=UPI003BA380FD